MRSMWLPILLSLSTAVAAQSSSDSCPRQPMPEAIDSAGPWLKNRFTPAIAFAATPSLEYPGRAWVVRLNRQNPADPGMISIIRLRRQSPLHAPYVRLEPVAHVPVLTSEAESAGPSPAAPLFRDGA